MLFSLKPSVYALFTLLKHIYITVLDVYSFFSLCAETWKHVSHAHAQIEDHEGHRMKLKRGSLS